jgi:LacI family transcriptional regulator
MLGRQAHGGTLRAVRAAGLAIPDDVSVICFGDTELAQVVAPTSSASIGDRWQLGRQAVDMRMARMPHPDASGRPADRDHPSPVLRPGGAPATAHRPQIRPREPLGRVRPLSRDARALASP